MSLARPPFAVLLSAAVAGLVAGACTKSSSSDARTPGRHGCPAPPPPDSVVVVPPASATPPPPSTASAAATAPSGRDPVPADVGKPHGTAAARNDGPPPPTDRHACKGQNACKGQGGCKTDRHSCKGKNDCKGQGGCKV